MIEYLIMVITGFAYTLGSMLAILLAFWIVGIFDKKNGGTGLENKVHEQLRSYGDEQKRL